MDIISHIGAAELVFQWEIEINPSRARNCLSVLRSEVADGRIPASIGRLASSDESAYAIVRLAGDKRCLDEMSLLQDAKGLTLTLTQSGPWRSTTSVAMKGQVPAYRSNGTRLKTDAQVKIKRALDAPPRRLRVKAEKEYGTEKDNGVCD